MMGNIFKKKYLIAVLSLMVLLFISQGCGGPKLRFEEGQKLFSSGRWDESYQYYKEAFKKHPLDAEIKLMMERSRLNASLSHMARGEAYLKKSAFEKAGAEFQQSIEFDTSNMRAKSLFKKADSMKRSADQFQKGSDLFKAQEYEKARNAFQKALELNPKNQDALKSMDYFRGKLESRSKYGLDLVFAKPVSFKFKKSSIINVFEVLSRISGINFIFDKDMPNTKVTLFMTDVSFERFMEVLLQTNKLAAKLVDKKTMLIYPDTSLKARDYNDLQIRTFYLANLKAKKAVRLISKILKSKDIIANEKLNAIVIRGTKASLDIASKIIEANDRPSSEVLFNVEIMEVSRTREKQLGMEVNPTSVTFGIAETGDKVSKDSVFASSASIYSLENLTNKELMLSIPTATLHFLKQDTNTKTLASPQIRVKNNEKATIHIGERVPLRTNRRVDTTGNITFDYQYQDIGVKLDAEPFINMNGMISLKLSLEVSALGANVGTIDDPQYAIKTRKATSVLMVKDGEPVIIGGLINDDERETIKKVPLLGDIPMVGRIFSNKGSNDIKTDILMSITPVIIRNKKPPGKEVTEIWSGNEMNFSMKQPFDEAPRENVYKSVESTENEGAPNPGMKNSHGKNHEWPASVPFSIHVNSFPQKNMAINRLQELEALDYKCFMSKVNVEGKGIFYRIFVGSFKDLKAAKTACDQYKTRKEFASDIHPVDREWSFKG